MWEQSIPKMKWEMFVCAAEDADEVHLEGLDGLFGHVAMVIVRWDQLVSHFVVANCLLEIGRALIVEDVSPGGYAGAFQSVYECLICANHFARCAILHWLLEDPVAVGVREDHDVLVAAT